ncbi:MAG: 3-deoxy-D-manno-octulosonic acid transferase [Thermodesulfovibrio sp.]|nr:3-deoxy-D-manno-octulosonic acid transferase [Thermodesulfovibrio sp.]
MPRTGLRRWSSRWLAGRTVSRDKAPSPMYFIYSLLYTAAVTVLLIPQYLKRPAKLRRIWLREKLGISGIDSRADNARPFWVHAVSVGEVTAAIPLVNALRASFPDTPVILSTMTDTGRGVALSKVPAGVSVVYMPFDFSCIMKRFMRRVSPLLFLIVETEIWPHAIRAAQRQGVPVIMVNGRISAKSFRGYAVISGFMKTVLDSVTLFLMQTEEDAERMRLLGAERSKVIVAGSFKFDSPDQQTIPSWAAALKGTVIVAGSTHAGEEELVIAAFRRNLAQFPSLKLVLAPRHPERFAEVEKVVRESGLPFFRRTQFREGEDIADTCIIILDSIGELSVVYGAADIAVIGKSFLGHGGQNPLEPALWGKAILCGPHMENFPFIRDFYQEGAAFEVTAEGLAGKLGELLSNPSLAMESGKRARKLYAKNSGAVERSLAAIRKHMS